MKQPTQISWDQSMIEKYNYSGPRYTSYPTALEFDDTFTEQNLLTAIENSKSDKLSLYIHIPFCAKLCYYCGCNKVITRHQHKADQYIEYLSQEIIKRAPPVQTLQCDPNALGRRYTHFLKSRANFKADIID